MNDFPDNLRLKMIEDLDVMSSYHFPAWKEIYVVVHNQLPYVKRCLESVMRNTERYDLWVWDNGSDDETREYLEGLSRENKISLHRSEENMGFIGPVNQLFGRGMFDYAIFLNSDTEVAQGWDLAMLAQLACRRYLGVVGYQGGLLDENGRGDRVARGFDIDYVAGWCFAIRRSDFTNSETLFDSENLRFAYGEDSDLSLRLRERGFVPYALHLDLVIHHGNKTVMEVAQQPEAAERMRRFFEANHEYIRSRWAEYLTHQRIDLQT